MLRLRWRHGERLYDPVVGRFISEDPIGFAAGDTNVSRYVGNGVTTATDPSGLESWEELVEQEYKLVRQLNKLFGTSHIRLGTVSKLLLEG
jgi:uncharacterized protein RhaS with RHS repeats